MNKIKHNYGCQVLLKKVPKFSKFCFNIRLLEILNLKLLIKTVHFSYLL